MEIISQRNPTPKVFAKQNTSFSKFFFLHIFVLNPKLNNTFLFLHKILKLLNYSVIYSSFSSKSVKHFHAKHSNWKFYSLFPTIVYYRVKTIHHFTYHHFTITSFVCLFFTLCCQVCHTIH